MTLDEGRLGRLLMIGFEQSAWDEALAEWLAEIKPGGVVFFQRNTTGGATGFRELVIRTGQALGGAAFLAADLEGGTVDRLRDLLTPFPSARSATEAHDDPLVRRFGALVGEALRAFGLNTNFAPVLDVAGPSLGTRAAGEKPAEVVRFARNFLEGMAGQGVAGCGKHFPGLGSGAVDTHMGMAVIDKPSEKLWEEDLLPFRELAASLPVVMVSHAFYPSLEPEGTRPRPASLSPHIITELLRKKIGYPGLVASDDLEMGGALQGRTVGEAAVAAVEAGCQLLLICSKQENVRAVRRALVECAERDPEFAARVEAAARAVEAFAEKYLRVEAGPAPDLADLRKRIGILNRTVEGMATLGIEAPVPGAAGRRPAPDKKRGGPRGGGGKRPPRPPRRAGSPKRSN